MPGLGHNMSMHTTRVVRGKKRIQNNIAGKDQNLEKRDTALLRLCVQALDFSGTSPPIGNHCCATDLHN
eukprot:4628923-Amphidinium_carterae.1